MAEGRITSRPHDATTGARGRLPIVRGDGGFTLVELLVVVVIIGILIAIAIPTYSQFRRGARDRAAQTDVHNAVGALESCRNSEELYPGTPGDTVTVTSTVTVCPGEQANVSADTTVTYTVAADSRSYVVVGSNSGGKPTWYCFNSAVGGTLRSSPTAINSC